LLFSGYRTLVINLIYNLCTLYNMNDLLSWLYGKSARNAHIRDMAKKALSLLKEHQSLEYQELCKLLGIEFDQYQKPKRTFYFVVNPLKKVKLIQEKRVYPEKGKRKYNTVYFLTPDRFRGYMDHVIEDFHMSVK